MSEKKCRHCTAEYKAESITFYKESGRSLPSVAEELGVHADQLRSRRNEILAAGTAEALAKQKAQAAELARLRRENRRLKPKNEIVKCAVAFSHATSGHEVCVHRRRAGDLSCSAPLFRLWAG